MSNILTDNTRTRRLAASVLAGVVLLGGMAGLSGTAMAAGAGTITLTAPADETLANHTFSAYKIGDYSGYADANANGKIDSTNVTNAAGTQAWLKAALAKAGLSVDSAKGLDEAGTLAATTQAAKLSTVANALADAANKPGAVVADKTSNTGSLTLNVPGEGLYLVVDSDGLPIIVGTQIDGKDLEHQALGTAVIKSTSISVDKEGSGDTTIAGDYTIVGNTHNRFTRDGYEFQGWSQDPKATAASLRTGDIIDVPQAGADLYAVWKRVKTEPTPVPTLPQTGGMLGLIGGLVAVILLTGAGIAFKRRG